MDADRIARRLRARGAPYVRPQTLVVSSNGPLDDAMLTEKLHSLGTSSARCGLALTTSDGRGEALVAIRVEPLADLAPFPVAVSSGVWLELSAHLLVPATAAKLFLVGSHGLPRAVPTSLDARSGKVRARFALERPGAYTVQLLADLEGGPTPVLEARVFADVSPSEDDTAPPLPGLDDRAEDDDDDALERLIHALRASSGAPPLTRNRRLDALAQAHAEEMKRTGLVAHDLGHGDLGARAQEAGLSARSLGENVARAQSLAAAHRALFESPSHRMNLLNATYNQVGLGIARTETGDIFVCEVFARGLR